MLSDTHSLKSLLPLEIDITTNEHASEMKKAYENQVKEEQKIG